MGVWICIERSFADPCNQQPANGPLTSTCPKNSDRDILMAGNVVQGMDKGTHQGYWMRETGWKACHQFLANQVVPEDHEHNDRDNTKCVPEWFCGPARLSYNFLKILKTGLKLAGFLIYFLVSV